jgi:hypothetical protein
LFASEAAADRIPISRMPDGENGFGQAKWGLSHGVGAAHLSCPFPPKPSDKKIHPGVGLFCSAKNPLEPID